MPSTPCEPDDLARLVDDTMLSGRPVGRATVPGSDSTVLWVRCSSDEVLDAWEAARAIVDRTGRWPVALWEVADFEEQITHPYSPQRPTAFEIIARAAAIGDDDVTRYWRTRREPEWIDADEYGRNVVQYHLHVTEQRLGAAPSPDDVARALGDRCVDVELERWLHEWEAERGLHLSSGHLSRFTDEFSEFAIAFTPVDDGADASAFFGFFGAEDPGEPEQMVALLRRWGNRWGAELIASYTTMLEFTVRRPPESWTEAWDVALEHHDLAPCTMQLPGVTIRHHARELVGRHSWHLHERP